MFRRSLLLVSLLVSVGMLLSTVPIASGLYAQADERCFSETGFCVSGRLLVFWNQNGGLPVFGYPITPQREEVIEGRYLQVQWFQRNRLELHPENAPPYDVLLGRLSEELLYRQGRIWQQTPRSTARQGCRFFNETGFNVCDDILAAWRANGLDLDGQPGKSESENLALFGLPLGDASLETIQGQQYMVQWFERARFEVHPENQPPYNVLLGLLGAEVTNSSSPSQPRETPLPSVPEQIAFQSNRDGQDEVYLMNVDGSDQQRLTQGSEDSYSREPTWSPDGSQIAFSHHRHLQADVVQRTINLMNTDGSGQTALTSSQTNPLYLGDPAWSSNQTMLAFHASFSGNNEIYTMNPSDRTPVNRTNNPEDDANPAWSPDDRWIAFQSDRSGNWDIYIMQADGSEQTPWLPSSGMDGRPTWSPDGKKIAFNSDRERQGNLDIYVANADGTNLQNLTTRFQGTTKEINPVWSADGSKIAFVSNAQGTWQIYIMNADDGSGAKPLTDQGDNAQPSWWALSVGAPTRLPDTPAPVSSWNPPGRIAFTAEANGNLEIFVMNANGSGLLNISNNAADDYEPVWSPDGSKLVFTSRRDGNLNIYVMNADGSGVQRLTDDIADDTNPDWSPDGTRIVFNSERLGEGQLFPNADIYIMNADGSNQTNLTSSEVYEWRPAWSPDGRQIAFESAPNENHDIYVMNVDGSGKTQLTNDPGFDEYPAWSPDGSRLLFQTDRNGKYEVYVMNANGTNQVNLTNDPDHDMHPVWSPDGRYITFMSDREGNEEIFVMNADGSGQTNVTNRPAADRFPDWTQ